MEDEIINKVSLSGLITFDLEEFYPTEEVVEFDIKELLYMGLIVKEKEFREALKNIDFSKYKSSVIALFCSSDAIVPIWAYSLIVKTFITHDIPIFIGTKEDVIEKLWIDNLEKLNYDDFKDKKVVLKGCGKKNASHKIYSFVTAKFIPLVYSLFYGEPCSTVPIYKKSSK